MSTELADVTDLRKEIADLEEELSWLRQDLDRAEENAEEDAREIVDAALKKLRAFMDDIARECHGDYGHADLFPFCRATPCSQVRAEGERMEAEQRRTRR